MRLISVGSKGQTPDGLRSQAMTEILSSSRPDYIVMGLGLTDALAEPSTRQLLENYRRSLETADNGLDAAIGPLFRASMDGTRPAEDSGPPPEPSLVRLGHFVESLHLAVANLREYGIGSILITPPLVTNDPDYPLNSILRVYARRVREVGQAEGTPVVDAERAFRNMFDRAANYKQKAALSNPDGTLNAQGQTLIARTFLDTFGLLPGPGFRPKP